MTSKQNTSTVKTEETQIAQIERDRFASAEYVDANAKLPRIVALRGENGAEDCGYFITEENLAKAGWYNLDIKDLREYEFNSGGKEFGLLIKKPRMLVVQRSPLFAFDRQLSQQEQRTVVDGRYDRNRHADKAKYGTATCYEVLLLNASNQPLSETSFAYVAKGANAASFNEHWRQLLTEVTKFHAIANGIPARPKDARFNVMCVFEFTVKRELAGTNAKSPACKVDSHTVPTQANWEQFFVGRGKDADYFLDLLAPSNQLVLPASEMLALPEGAVVDPETGEYVF